MGFGYTLGHSVRRPQSGTGSGETRRETTEVPKSMSPGRVETSLRVVGRRGRREEYRLRESRTTGDEGEGSLPAGLADTRRGRPRPPFPVTAALPRLHDAGRHRRRPTGRAVGTRHGAQTGREVSTGGSPRVDVGPTTPSETSPLTRLIHEPPLPPRSLGPLHPSPTPTTSRHTLHTGPYFRGWNPSPDVGETGRCEYTGRVVHVGGDGREEPDRLRRNGTGLLRITSIYLRSHDRVPPHRGPPVPDSSRLCPWSRSPTKTSLGPPGDTKKYHFVLTRLPENLKGPNSD